MVDVDARHSHDMPNIVAFVAGFAPDEAARQLAQLDGRLIDRLCRAQADADARADGVSPGIAYWLLRDALARCAAGG